ncbi:ORF6N domain-containing protein [Heyndrickxia oleronia]|uniref:ORF6N domain-containing protein n=1 Tax=Heyndrickxia oleronia TaxID=38875 RepID=UPI001C0EF59D|nr:ORF6N domain-containing protein [Heyndrickxia oleronia]MBU5214390.1 ORF6N domain-containing protein [Heyndrickxia oleronia]
MSQLKVIEQNNQRVLTTAQLAESYGTTTDKISYNFNYNEKRYKHGKHFFLLTGNELKLFKEANREFQGSINKLYLWTEKGAWLHAKSLNTDEAWEAYEMLVDDYYCKKESDIDLSLLSPEMQMFKMTFDAVAKVQMEAARTQLELKEVQSTVKTISETFLRKDEDWRKSINSMLNSAARKLGGNYRDLRTESYRLLEERGRCNLNIRLANLKDRLAESGATKTKINQTTRMDVIESDTRLKEIYTTIIKELSIGALHAK